MAQETVSGGRSFEMPEHCRFCRMTVIEKREPTEVVVNDKMQKNYRYMLTEPEGKNFHPDFKPELTPIQMLAMGVFEGKYITDCWEEFPEEWFEHAILSPEKSNPLYNYFGVKSRLSLSEWRRRGWIVGPVSVVLPLLLRPPSARSGRNTNQTLAFVPPPFGTGRKKLHAVGCCLPDQAASGFASMGL